MFYQIGQKSPQGDLNLGFDWSAFLVADTITTASVAVCPGDTSGVTLGAAQHTDTDSFCFVSGGAVGTTAEIVWTINTSGGETQDATLLLQIVAVC